MKFRDIAFRSEIQTALSEMGYEDLSPIQEKTLLPILENRDILAVAETGSGKTSACGIPLIQLLDEESPKVQVLVLVPTRELALQYEDELRAIGRHTKVQCVSVYGGAPMDMQRKQIKHGAQILVATPGRLIDMLHTGELQFDILRTLVLDEADEMLKMGFIEDVQFIMSCIVGKYQKLFFSATMPKQLDIIVSKFLDDPLRIELNNRNVAPSSLRHEFVYMPGSGDREAALIDFLEDRGAYRQVLIFSNSRLRGDRLYRRLRQCSLTSYDYLHGGMDQDKRTRIFDSFKKGTLRILIATDVAGRGLDFSNVSHVINYDFPRDTVSYTHRTGRAGRMGKTGVALSYVTDPDIYTCRQVIESNRIESFWHNEPPAYSRNSRPRQRRVSRGHSRTRTR